MNLLEWLQNLKQHSRPIGALCGKQGRIHGRLVADGLAGAVMQKPLAI